MKTSELRECLRDLGYRLDVNYIKKYCSDDDRLAVINRDGMVVASVSNENRYDIDMRYKVKEFDESKRQVIFELLVEYAKTPIEQREDWTAYAYKLKQPKNIEYGSQILAFNTTTRNWRLVPEETWSDGKELLFFTYSWLKDLGVDIDELKTIFDEIEIKRACTKGGLK